MSEIIQEKIRKRGGPRAGAGRPKGVPNKVHHSMKIAIAEAFEQLGGTQRMVQWAQEDPKHLTEFYKLAARLIPVETQVTGSNGGPIQTVLEIVGIQNEN
jgi:hypothetical protein